MLNFFIETTSMGIITFIIGTIIFNLTINKENLSIYNQKKYPVGINLSFFMIGVVMHLVLESCGINNWYCNKCKN
jgi:hypothetical protein